MKKLLFSAFAALIPIETYADQNAFVEANLLAIFYHELGHAAIDTMALPVFGQEEDAADVASVLLLDAFYDEESVVEISRLAALGFLIDADNSEENAFWDVHGPDEQRYYNLVCLIYGANPDEREDFADELGLPKERAETCEEEFEIAADSWGSVFDDLAELSDGFPLEFVQGGNSFAGEIIRAEVEALAADFSFPEPIVVNVDDCGEVNAFYDPVDLTITICTELEDHLQKMAGEEGLE